MTERGDAGTVFVKPDGLRMHLEVTPEEFLADDRARGSRLVWGWMRPAPPYESVQSMVTIVIWSLSISR